MNTDLTVGKPWKVLLKYILPLFGSAFFQQLYTMADTIIAGKFAGETALTAIGASNAIVNILMAIALGANAGCAVLASRYFGAKENGKVKSTIYTALISFAALSVILLLAGILSCRAILEGMNTPSIALDDSVLYLNIYYYGLPFLILYNLGTGIFSALGDSRTPFIFLVISSVCNIILDYILVQKYGVAGVAWATFIAQGAACLLTMVFVFRRTSGLKSEDKPVAFSGGLLKLLLLLALPVALQNSFVSVGNFVIQFKINELANEQGIGITNGFTAGFKVLVFCTTCFCTCANGLTNFVSQNYGAHKFARIKRGYYSTLVISTILTGILATIAFVFSEPLVKFFMAAGADNTLAVETGKSFLHITALFFFVVNVKMVSDCTVRGCNGNVGFMISTLSDLVLRVGFVFLLTPFWGFAGVGWAWSFGWILGTGVALAFYFTIPCLRKKNMIKYDEDGKLKPEFMAQ